MKFKIVIVMIFFILSCSTLTKNRKNYVNPNPNCNFIPLNDILDFVNIEDECILFAQMVQKRLKYCECNQSTFYNDTIFWGNLFNNQDCLNNYRNSNILQFFQGLDSINYTFFVSDTCDSLHSYKHVYRLWISEDSIRISKRSKSGVWRIDY